MKGFSGLKVDRWLFRINKINKTEVKKKIDCLNIITQDPSDVKDKITFFAS